MQIHNWPIDRPGGISLLAGHLYTVHVMETFTDLWMALCIFYETDNIAKLETNKNISSIHFLCFDN